MAQLASHLAQLQQNQIEQNEAQLASCFQQPPNSLTAQTQALLTPFIAWCQGLGVRPVPARPTTIASYLQYTFDLGITLERTLEVLAAIEAMHDCVGASNPVQTAVVSNLLETVLKLEPPRSWKREEQQAWALLPPMVRQAISRREANREKEIRRLQNKTADELKRHTDGADSKPVELKEELISNE
jgi:hypothetical protein